MKVIKLNNKEFEFRRITIFTGSNANDLIMMVKQNEDNILNQLSSNKRAQLRLNSSYTFSGSGLSAVYRESLDDTYKIAGGNNLTTSNLLETVQMIKESQINHNLVIIYYPEYLLSSRAQSNFGKYLATSIKKKKNIDGEYLHYLVLTQSEYLISGLQIGAIKEKFNSEVIIHYFKDDEEVSVINIDKDGDLDNYPEGFFDQTQYNFIELHDLITKGK